MKTLDVVAAVITDRDNRVLLARRKEGKSQAGYWEFPGGKVEANESHSFALHRELLEEFSIDTVVGEFIASNEHDYGTARIRLYAYHVAYLSGYFHLVDHDMIEWVPKDRVSEYCLAPADVPILYHLLHNTP